MTRKHAALGAAILAIAALPGLARAEDERDARLRALEERVRALEARAAPAGPTATAAAPAARRKPLVEDLRLDWQEYPGIATADGRHRVTFSGRAEADLRGFEPDEDDNRSTTFLVRRARLSIGGVFFGGSLEGVVDTEVGPVATGLRDGWIQLGAHDAGKVRAGQYRIPHSLELLRSARYLEFAERSLMVLNLGLDRDTGVMLHGEVAGGALGYQVGIFNGTGINKVDSNDDKDFIGRVVWKPLAGGGGPLRAAQLGVSGSAGNQQQAPLDFRLASATTFLAWDKTVLMDGKRWRSGAEVAVPLGGMLLQAEGMRMELDQVRRGAAVEDDLVFHAGYVAASALITGETKTLGRVVPRRSVPDGGPGAIELAVRYEVSDAPVRLLARGYATGTDRAECLWLAASWYPTTFCRLQIDYLRSWLDDAVPGLDPARSEDAVIARIAFYF